MVINKNFKVMYPIEMVNPMKADLTDFGFQSLENVQDVENAITQKGTCFVVINSVCGCAAGNARPGAKMAIQGENKPDRITTVFAGVDKDAVNKAREFMLPFPPSSPSMALFKDGELVHMLGRQNIEGASAHAIAVELMKSFEEFCK